MTTSLTASVFREQKAALIREAKRRKITLSALVREIVVAFLDRHSCASPISVGSRYSREYP
jgi:hypothetical protein